MRFLLIAITGAIANATLGYAMPEDQLGARISKGTPVITAQGQGSNSNASSIRWLECQFSGHEEFKTGETTPRRTPLGPKDERVSVFAFDPAKGELSVYGEKTQRLFRLSYVTADEQFIRQQQPPSVTSGVKTEWSTTINRETGRIEEGWRMQSDYGISSFMTVGFCAKIEPKLVTPIEQKF